MSSHKKILPRVLFIDDEQNILSSIKRQLRKLFDVHTALSGREAFLLIGRGIEYAVIVCDIRMPVMDGIEFFEHLKEIAPNTARIALTGNADMDTAVESVNRGHVFRFLLKPCATSVMAAAINDGVIHYRYLRGLREKAMRDSLTGFFNHNTIFEKLDGEIERAQRYAHQLSILMLDIDFFKEVNDTYGHLEGDRVLVSISNLLRRTVRNTDIVGRYGGEEFLIIFPETDIQTAFITAERIRKGIEQLEFERIMRRITISGGVREYCGESMGELVKKADDLLYLAKRSGRNRIEGLKW